MCILQANLFKVLIRPLTTHLKGLPITFTFTLPFHESAYVLMHVYIMEELIQGPGFWLGGWILAGHTFIAYFCWIVFPFL